MLYHAVSRELQDRFDTRRIADRLEGRTVRATIDDDDRRVGLLFLSFEERRRSRLEGVVQMDDNDPLLDTYPEAQLVVRVRAERVYPNCPRYIHHYRLVERSRFVPKQGRRTPMPQWKHAEWSHDALPDGDPAYDPDREVIWKG